MDFKIFLFFTDVEVMGEGGVGRRKIRNQGQSKLAREISRTNSTATDIDLTLQKK